MSFLVRLNTNPIHCKPVGPVVFPKARESTSARLRGIESARRAAALELKAPVTIRRFSWEADDA